MAHPVYFPMYMLVSKIRTTNNVEAKINNFESLFKIIIVRRCFTVM